jgi:two-component system chemotaxis response regulator CheB
MAARKFLALVAGGSTGSLEALTAILPALPARYPLSLCIVLHILPERPSHLVEVLERRCRLPVKEAEDKEPLAPATVYLAVPNYHLLIEKKGYFSLSIDERVHFSRPSIDVLFESAADAYGPALVGVLLSGANQDGAAGLARIKEKGGLTIVQSPDTASVPTMPLAALRLAAVDHVLPLAEIGPFLARLSPQESKGAPVEAG